MREHAKVPGDNRTPEFNTLGYDLAERFLGQNVRVFMHSGSVLSGELVEAKGKYILVRGFGAKEALINLDHVASLTRM
jgi:hypothetical protein